MDKFENLKKRIDRKFDIIDNKMWCINDGIKGMAKSFKEFKAYIDEFIDFTADNYKNHEKRISDIEKRI